MSGLDAARTEPVASAVYEPRGDGVGRAGQTVQGGGIANTSRELHAPGRLDGSRAIGGTDTGNDAVDRKTMDQVPVDVVPDSTRREGRRSRPVGRLPVKGSAHGSIHETRVALLAGLRGSELEVLENTRATSRERRRRTVAGGRQGGIVAAHEAYRGGKVTRLESGLPTGGRTGRIQRRNGIGLRLDMVDDARSAKGDRLTRGRSEIDGRRARQDDADSIGRDAPAGGLDVRTGSEARVGRKTDGRGMRTQGLALGSVVANMTDRINRESGVRTLAGKVEGRATGHEGSREGVTVSDTEGSQRRLGRRRIHGSDIRGDPVVKNDVVGTVRPVNQVVDAIVALDVPDAGAGVSDRRKRGIGLADRGERRTVEPENTSRSRKGQEIRRLLGRTRTRIRHRTARGSSRRQHGSRRSRRRLNAGGTGRRRR